jgi:1-acyl-sn-glycerol-3-phosphate acyltransferase
MRQCIGTGRWRGHGDRLSFGMFYRSISWCARTAMRWCYREARLIGDVPATGPVLLAVNHPNDLPDICAVLAFAGRDVTFVANVASAEQPIVAWAYRKMGVIPVHRVRDARRARARGHDSAAANAQAFARVREVLAAGGLVCVFPEGGVQRGVELAPLRTGLARMALDARAAGIDGVRIVPMRLTYESTTRIRVRMRGEVREVLDMDTWPVEGTRAQESQLTARIAERLRPDDSARHDQSPARASSLRFVVGAPVALTALALHAPAWTLGRWWAHRAATMPEEVIPRRIIPGLYFMTAWYLLLLCVLGAMLHTMGLPALWAALLSLFVIMLLPALATFGLRWRDRLHDRRARHTTSPTTDAIAHDTRPVT